MYLRRDLDEEEEEEEGKERHGDGSTPRSMATRWFLKSERPISIQNSFES